MKKRHNSISLPVLFLTLFLSLLSCDKDQIPLEVEELPNNTFAMELNGQLWQPGQLRNNKCLVSYYGAWSLANKPYFNIVAYRDSKGFIDVRSENILRIQVMNVTGLGNYDLTGSPIQGVESHALFTVTKPDGNYVRYVNKHNSSSFSVVFEEFIQVPSSSTKGVRGVFSGTLYNDTNPLDSIVISKGGFTFNRTNRYDFNQCD